jgi:solute carrier family 25 carnitine/acylcarnitine transporter 20/29
MTLSDAWVDFLAGWFSGAAAVVVCQPVDTILTRMQAGVVVGSSTGSSSGNAGTVSAVAHSRTLLETAGITALWRGSSPMITAVPLQNALLMGGYGVGQKYAEQYAPQHKLAAVFVGGSTGGFLQSFLMSPVEFIKVSQQCAGSAAGSTSTGATTAKQAVWKLLTESNAGVWRRGLGATLLRDGLPHGVWFTTYEVTKRELTAYYASVREEAHMLNNMNNSQSSISTETESVEEQVLVPLVAGAWAATAAWTVGYPADLIKTRIQVGSSQGIIGTARLLIQESGGSVVAGLYRGFGLKLVRSVPASMIGFSVYEYVKKHIERNL